MEVIAMSHPDILMALAAAHREELLRLAEANRVVVSRNRRRQRHRLIAWLDGQRLGHRRAPATLAACVAVTR
jgi:hypothetical protein